MQFSCESCKALLQIADERVKGKRLVVRCKRCGAKISISDPALAGGGAVALVSGASSASAPPPISVGPVSAAPAPVPSAPAASQGPSAAPRAAPHPTPSPGSLSAPARSPTAAPVRPVAQAAAPAAAVEDTENTRAMDSDLLEKALLASKGDDAAAAAGPRAAAPAPSAAAAPTGAARAGGGTDLPIWFAMLGGKQAGPLTRKDLAVKTDEAVLGPRTYVWKEGMSAWQRAKDVPELASLFGGAPPAEVAAPSAPPGAASSAMGRTPPSASNGSSAGGTAVFAAPPQAAAAAKAAAAARAAAPAPVPAASVPAPALAAPSTPQQPATPRKGTEDLFSEALQAGPAQPAAPRAEDLASWASSELGKRQVSQPSLPAVAPHAEPESPALQPARAAPPASTLPAASDLSGSFIASARHDSGSGKTVGLVIALVALAAAGAWFFFARGEKAEDRAPAVAAAPASKPAAAPPRPAGPGPLNRVDVRKRIDDNKSALQACIDDAVRRDPTLRVGALLLTVQVAPTGSVVGARTNKPAVEDGPLGVCLKRVARGITFPAFSGSETQIEIPLSVKAGP